jgi:sulfotransferase family protein
LELLASAPPLDPGGIILSSGRCGSTLLSTLIAGEPQTLSVPESLGPVLSHLALLPPAQHVTGAQYWSLLSSSYSESEAMNRVGTVLSGLGDDGTERSAPDQGKDERTGGVPPIMLVTLPLIAAHPDLLFAVLAEEVPHFPPQPLGLHHKMLLDLLATLTGKRRWVERSGASSPVAEPLLRAMPDARIVYLTRNIADTARSMSKHVSFQFALARYEFHVRYDADPYHPELRASPMPDPAELPEALRRLLPDRITAEALRDLGRDMTRYEAMCANMMSLAEQAFADLKPRHLHRIRYEDLVLNPAAELTQLGEFLGFADPAGWAARAARQVRPPRTSTAQLA